MCLINVLIENGTRVNLLSIHVDDPPEVSTPNLNLTNLWGCRASFARKVFSLIRNLTAAPTPLYVRKPNSISAMACLILRATRKRVALGIASDLDCLPVPGEPARNLWKWICLRLSSDVLVQTLRQQAQIRLNYGVESTVFNNLIDLGRFSNARTVAFGDRDIDVLWVGTLTASKGVEILLEVIRRCPHLGFAVIGDDDHRQGSFGDKARQSLRAAKNVIAPGFVNPDQVPSWFGRSKSLLHTSVPVAGTLTKEGFPNVFLEAWASHTVVVSMYANPDSVLTQNNVGYVTPSVGEAVDLLSRITEYERTWLADTKRASDYVVMHHESSVEAGARFLNLLLDRSS